MAGVHETRLQRPKAGAPRRATLAGASALAITTALTVVGAAHAQTTAAQGSTAQGSTSPPDPATAAQSTSTLPEPAVDETGAASDVSTVAEIVVTAQKRSERLQDVPISISVVNPALLAQTNAKNLNELSGAVPGIQLNGNGGGGRTYVQMRGTTGSALNIGDEPVAVYLDDVYAARGLFIGNADLLDVGSIEIVRGPQGTLQGRNATAGAILVRSADPTPTPQGYFTAQVQDPLEYRAQGAVSGPLGRGFRGRAALGYAKAEGFGTNTFNDTRVGGSESAQIRGVLTYAGDNPLTARIVADYASIGNTPALFRNAATNFSPLATGALVTAPTPTTPLPVDQRVRIYKKHEYNLDPNTNTTLNTNGLSAKLAYAFPAADLVSVTGYRRAHVFGTNNSSGLATAPRQGYNNNNDRSVSFTQEVRLQSSGPTRFSWILGGYYFNEDQDYADTIYSLRFSTPTALQSFYFGNQETVSYAAFADATFNFTDQLQVIGGARYTQDDKTLRGGIRVTNQTTGVVTNTPYNPPTDSWDSTTYRAKLVYKPSRNLTFYAGYGTGFRAGGYNAFAVQPAFAPEEIKSYEVGAKGDLFQRRLGYSVTAYQNDYTNLQLRAGVPTGGAIITNAADSEIKGFEAELNARPFERTRLSANMSYTDAIFSSFPRAVDVFNAFVDASGNRLPNAPELQYFVSAAQDFPLANGWTLTADANYRWRDEIFFYFTNQDAPTFRDDPGGQLNGRVSVQSPDEKWTFAAFVSNLTDSRLVTTDVITFSYPEVSLNIPRTFGVALERRF